MPTSHYQPGSSFLHRLHPMTKLVFSLCAALVIFIGPGDWWCATLPGLLAIMLLWPAGLIPSLWRAIWRFLVPFSGMLFLIHGLFSPQNENILASWGPLTLGEEGLVYAALVSLRLASTLCCSLVLALSSHPADLIQALMEAGLPRQLAYVIGSPLLLLPQIAGRIQAIQAAQQARGLEIGGDMLRRVKALMPLVAPLVFSSLIDVEERALALDVRGFSAPGVKTSLNELRDSRRQRICRWCMVALALALSAAGIIMRAYGHN